VRNQLAKVLSALAMIALVGCSTIAASQQRPTSLPATPPTATPLPTPAPALFASLTPWQLPSPISRSVVLPDNHGLIIASGLTANGQSTSGVFRASVADGTVSFLGNLPTPVHDAAGAMLHGRLFVFGGGSPSPTASIQSLNAEGQGGVASRLPTPRSDLTTIAAGRQIYLLGGYDGTALSPAVLATTDGLHFHQVAQLPVPVRYAAAAALGSRIFVFGGQRGTADTTVIQEVNVHTHRAWLAGHLPSTLSHASAIVLEGHVYLLGGFAGGTVSRRILSFDPRSGQVKPAGDLPMAIADGGAATLGRMAYLVGGEDASGPQAAVMVLQPASSAYLTDTFPFAGKLLIADRGNNRLLLVNAQKRLLWTYPSLKTPTMPGGFYFPDDAFFVNRGRSIIVNEEQNEAVVRIAFPGGRLEWSYGHPGTAGSAPGYLHEPDDAYLLKNGQLTVADDQNCRVLFLNPAGAIVHQIGTIGYCAHQPPAALGSPNGDTPLANGDVLISEINGSWISEYTPIGRLVWTVQLPIAYPSDPQQIGPDRYLVADYNSPGGIYEFNRTGKILWSYSPSPGPGMLDHPSLAERLPNGLIIANDDYRHRVVIINPVAMQIVWQYGETDVAGTNPGLLNTPDGLDLLGPGGQTPTHSSTG
jgi:Kelch motif